MTSLHKLREIVEDRLDSCFRALPSPLQFADRNIYRAKFRELNAVIDAYRFILNEIKILQESASLEPEVMDDLQKQ